MSGQQPVWQLVAQLGDAHPIEYGGHWVFVDITDVYPPEAEVYEPYAEADSSGSVWRYVLEPCTYINSCLSDNKYHPEHPVWFAIYLDSLAAFAGLPTKDLISQFTSDDPINRAFAWKSVADYWGLQNLDGYPLELSEAEVESRYTDAKYHYTNEETPQ